MKTTDGTIDSGLQSEPIRSVYPYVAGAVLLLWGATIYWLAKAGFFVAPQGSPPINVAIAAVAPGLVFWIAYRRIKGVRDWVTRLDLAHVVAMQAWRVVGGVFLFLLGMELLPAAFALPAGVGDVLVGLAAAFVAVNVARGSANHRQQSYFIIVVGMVDFVIAIGTGILSGTGRVFASATGPTSDLMQYLPMVLIPAFLVPVFIILHLVAWLKLRQRA